MVYKFKNFLIQTLLNPLDSPLFILFSKHVYGNLAGFRNNFYGKCHLSFFKIKNYISNTRNDENRFEIIASEIHKKGFSYLPFKLNVNLLEKINKKSNLISSKLPLQNNCSKTLTFNELEEFHEDIFKLFDKNLTKVLEAYYKSNFRVSGALKKYTYHIDTRKNNNKEVYSDHWHTDSSPYSMLGIFVLMKKTDNSDGPMILIDMKDTKNIIRNGYVREKNVYMKDYIENSFSKVNFTGDIGNVLICRISSCLHRASIPKFNHSREMMILHTFPISGKNLSYSYKKGKIEKITNIKLKN